MDTLQTDLFADDLLTDDHSSSALEGYAIAEDEEIQSVYRTITSQWSPTNTSNQPLVIEHPLPSCGDDSRFLPWVLARSCIFTSLADKDFASLAKRSKDKSITFLDAKTIAAGKDKEGGAALMRPWRFESEVALWGNGSIRATGPVLGQTELKVLMHLLWLGRANGQPGDSDFTSHPDEGYIRFSLNQLCGMLGKQKSFKDRQRIKEAMYCMTKVSLNIVHNGNRFNGALISEFLQHSDQDRCIIKVPKSIAKLFMPVQAADAESPVSPAVTKSQAGSYSKIPTRYLNTVRSARASWLINFLISHDLERFNMFSESQLLESMGLKMDELSPKAKRDIRHRLKKDFTDLIKIGVIKQYKYDVVNERFQVYP
ncbi:MAG: hypothetical protein IBX50_07720 [Marinospirillum sp.]|uniref:hypothetical protein n=1 Tax=Marinospirillum sp. TaxID=2183934 RepID=UPI001A0802A4|nr:hypothetical protein [Marinospirillum sp.]MBE0506595.1 hypothetical protein [Marinospirillum sp.]